jgi:hypothetical protein
MLDAQLGGSGGNLYKPEGAGANWALPFDAASFGKKTNEKAADFSDIQAALTALHAPHDDAAAWRAALEARFDVNLFLYSPPKSKGPLRWIPWDHNFAFGGAPIGDRGFGPGLGAGPNLPFPLPPAGAFVRFGGAGADVLYRQVGDDWPLIQRLLGDEVYAGRYRMALERALNGLLAPETFERRARSLHALVADAVLAERSTHTTISSADAFKTSLDGPEGLIARVRTRQATVRDALAQGRQR